MSRTQFHAEVWSNMLRERAPYPGGDFTCEERSSLARHGVRGSCRIDANGLLADEPSRRSPTSAQNDPTIELSNVSVKRPLRAVSDQLFHFHTVGRYDTRNNSIVVPPHIYSLQRLSYSAEDRTKGNRIIKDD